MSNHCKIEFYFKAEDMRKLLDENKGAKGIIIKQEIKPRKNADAKGFTNIVTITAEAKGITAAKAADGTEILNGTPIVGCPYPPGCDTED